MTTHLLYAGTHGHVTAIDKRDGRTVWVTSLPGTGFSVVSILPEDGRLFCASGGRTFALDPHDGSILWENEMPGLRRGLVYLATDAAPHGTASLLPMAQELKDAENAG